jgi:cyclic pyranopterin phosphate synthase
MATIIPIADQRKMPRPKANGELDALLDAAASQDARAGTLADALGRPLRDLRISVTDRCNFRCVYCMP